VAFGQDALALSSGAATQGGTIALSLSLTSPAGSEPAAIQWTLTYDAGEVASIAAVAGASASAADETIVCYSSAGSYTCMVAGMNDAIIQNGVVAVINLTMASSAATTTVSVTEVAGATAAADPISMTGTSGTITLPAAAAVAAAPAEVIGDFDGNGHPDLVWQNSNGTAVLWYMGGADGSTNLSSTYLSGPEPGWHIVAVADLDGNGHPDLIWQYTDGSVVVWYMGGAGGSTLLSYKYLSGPEPGWRLAAVADLDGNGHPDLIWQYTDGSVVVWYMGGTDGSTLLSWKYLSGPEPGWLVKAAADLDGNGHPDLIWQYTDGSLTGWYMGGTDGSTLLSWKYLSGPEPGWLVVAAAELAGNGHPDLIWQYIDGSVVVWYMGGTDGSTLLSSKYLAGPTPGWIVAAM
jgi:hypothetical protein